MCAIDRDVILRGRNCVAVTKRKVGVGSADYSVNRKAIVSRKRKRRPLTRGSLGERRAKSYLCLLFSLGGFVFLGVFLVWFGDARLVSFHLNTIFFLIFTVGILICAIAYRSGL